MTKPSNLMVLLQDVIDAAYNNIDDGETRADFYDSIITSFQSAVLENIEEALGVDTIFDSVFYENYPEMKDEEENNE